MFSSSRTFDHRRKGAKCASLAFEILSKQYLILSFTGVTIVHKPFLLEILARDKEGAVIARVGRPSNSGCIIRDKNKAPPRVADQDHAPCIQAWNSLATATGGLRGGQGSETPTRPPGAPRESVPSQTANSAEIPGPQGSEPGPSRSVSQSNKYLKTGPKTRS